MLKKIIKRGTNLLWQMLREQMYVLSKYPTKVLSSEDHRFVSLNGRYWSSLKSPSQKNMILVEGFFAAAGHNYLLRTGMLAKAIQAKEPLDIAVLFDKPAYQLAIEQKKYTSFGIEQFLYIKPGVASLIHYLKAIGQGVKYYYKMSSVDDILQLQHNGILLGDLIYDDLLKSEKNKYTIEKIEPLLLKRMIQTLYYYYCYQKLFKQYPIKYFITTHLVYAQYGMLARTALRYGVDVVETNDLMLNFLRAQNYQNKLIKPTYHFIVKEKIKEIISKVPDKRDLISFGEEALNKRMSGNVEQFDARFAFKDKIKISKEAFLQKMNFLDTSCPIIVIFAHVFSDAPHSSEEMLFRDYYEWLIETLKFAATQKHIAWVVRPHPSSKVYGEQGAIEKSADNIFFFPEEVSTSTLPDIADLLVTVQGTAGLEFSCLGLPVVVAGKAFYSEWGFTYEPKTKEEYFSLLSNAAIIKKLTAEQIKSAKTVFGAYMHSMREQSKIITSEALDAIWGYGENHRADLMLGNQIINDQLEKHDPKGEFQYQCLQEYVN